MKTAFDNQEGDRYNTFIHSVHGNRAALNVVVAISINGKTDLLSFPFGRQICFFIVPSLPVVSHMSYRCMFAVYLLSLFCRSLNLSFRGSEFSLLGVLNMLNPFLGVRNVRFHTQIPVTS